MPSTRPRPDEGQQPVPRPVENLDGREPGPPQHPGQLVGTPAGEVPPGEVVLMKPVTLVVTGDESEPGDAPRSQDAPQLGHGRRHPGLRNVEIGMAGESAGEHAVTERQGLEVGPDERDRKSTRLNSSHVAISYAVF